MRTKIIYEDNDILIAYKPAGLATQTAKVGQPDMVSELKNYLQGAYLGVIHRLDQPVEGLLAFGKTKAASAALTRALSQTVLHKQYYAVVCGKPTNASEILTDYLYKTKDNRAEMIAADNAEEIRRTGAKRAVLRYRVLHTIDLPCAVTPSDNADTTEEAISLLDVRIETGRFHQIRAQLAHAGFPILGDGKYATDFSKEFSRQCGVRNTALCAYRIELRHPVNGKEMHFTIKPEGEIFGKFNISDFQNL